MDPIFECFHQYMLEMGAFGTIAIGIIPLIVIVDNSRLEMQDRLLDLLRDQWEVSKSKGSSVGFNHFHEVDVMEI